MDLRWSISSKLAKDTVLMPLFVDFTLRTTALRYGSSGKQDRGYRYTPCFIQDPNRRWSRPEPIAGNYQLGQPWRVSDVWMLRI